MMSHIEINPSTIDLFMEEQIKSFFAMRELFTKNGLRELFEQKLYTLDPEIASRTEDEGNFDTAVDEGTGSSAGPASNSTPYDCQVDGYLWDESLHGMPECVLQEEVVTTGNDSTYVYQNSVADADTCNDAMEELEIIQEIPNNQSALAKSKFINGKLSSEPSDMPITHNLLGLRDLKRSTKIQNKNPPDSADGDSSHQVIDNQALDRTQKGVPPSKQLRHSPYQKLPRKPHAPEPTFYEKGLLKDISHGRVDYNIREISEHFGASKDYKFLLNTNRRGYGKISKLSQKEKDAKNSVARCIVHFLRATYGYDRAKEELDQICSKLAQVFHGSTPERWKMLCNSVPN